MSLLATDPAVGHYQLPTSQDVTMSWRSGGIGHCQLDLSVDCPQPQILLYRSMSATDAADPTVGHYQFQIPQEESVRSRPHST
jgi:hypothetical protein